MFDSQSSSIHALHERVLKLTVALYRVTDYFPKAEILRNDLRAKANEIFEQVTEYDTAAELDFDIGSLLPKIRTMKGYLAIASTLNYVRSLNFVILEKEYDLIEQFLEDEETKYRNQSLHEDVKNLELTPFSHSLAEKNATHSHSKGQADHKSSLSYEMKPTGERNIVSETQAPNARFYERKDNGLNERQKIIMDRLVKLERGKISDFYASFNGVSSKTIQRDLQNLVDKEMLKKEGEKRWTVYSLTEKR